jgi:ATP-dependent DNA helicase RecG
MIPWPPESSLLSPLSKRAGLGRTRLQILAKYGFIRSLDLLLVPPAAYRDQRAILSLGQAEDQKEIVFVGRVTGTFKGTSQKGRPWFKAEVEDGGYAATLWWFYGIPYLSQVISTGQTLIVSGKIVFKDNYRSQPSLTHPEICRVEEVTANFIGVKPVYRIYPGVPLTVFKKVMAEIVAEIPQSPPVLPPEWTLEHDLPDPLELLRTIHDPPPNPGPLPHPKGSRAYRRLSTYELMFWRLLIVSEKNRRQLNRTVRKKALDLSAGEIFWQHLPFAPTPEQLRVSEEFARDLSSDFPLNRLLQGEVGSGKTAVAGYVASLILAQGRQVAYLAPTDLLGRQHLEFLGPIIQKLGYRPAYLAASLTAKERREVLEALSDGRINLVIGTQSLLSDTVKFKDLGLAVIDEQQRFGVRQRLALTRKAPGLELMSMSATPIPRSLAQILYGDLDISIIKGTVPGRQMTKTVILDGSAHLEAYRQFLNFVRRGERGFIVCPRIGTDEPEDLNLLGRPDNLAELPLPETAGFPGRAEADNLFYGLPRETSKKSKPGRDLMTIEATLKELDPELKYGLLHGRQDLAHRQKVMADFKAGRLDVLVATTVIEVGVDVPEANLMLVEGADNFGLSQLHQLRGRVGRGGGQGLFLVLSSPQSGPKALARLNALAQEPDGFKLAEMDLTLRGPGEELGLKQSGWPAFKFVQLPRDLAFLPQALKLAENLLAQLHKWPDLEKRLAALAKELSVLPESDQPPAS